METRQGPVNHRRLRVLDRPSRQRRILAILVVSAVLIWIDSTVLGIALERLADRSTGSRNAGPTAMGHRHYSLLFATALFRGRRPR
jgi:hypothetical protein